MRFNPHHKFILPEKSYLGLVRREVSKLLETLGFSFEDSGRVNIIVSELSSNLIKHTGKGGELLVKPIGYTEVDGIEIISLDEGAGMVDPQKMLEDGVSTFGSKGEGLGAIKRISHDFDIFSAKDSGTVILSRFFKKGKEKKHQLKNEFNAVMIPKAGEIECGDAWYISNNENDVLLVLFDGLGHGHHAHQATEEALNVVRSLKESDPVDMMRSIHVGIRKTRGAVGAVCRINKKNNNMIFCGIGNISGRIWQRDNVKNLLSYNGALGLNIPNTVNTNNFELGLSDLIILNSDGLKSRWDLAKYNDLFRQDTSLIAAVLYKDFNRKTDDSLVVVGRIK